MTSATTQLNGTRLIFFSPTHTSARIARAIGEGIGMGRRMETDLTLDEQTSPIEMNGELCVIAVPVYGGRVAATALQRLQRLKGNGSPAILVVVYGNRDYEDALLELRDTAVQLGFVPLCRNPHHRINSKRKFPLQTTDTRCPRLPDLHRRLFCLWRMY